VTEEITKTSCRLWETCPECGFPTVEKSLSFKGEKVTVCACLNPRCGSGDSFFYDWEVPAKVLDEDGEIVDEGLFDEASQWAREQATKIRSEFFSRQPIRIELRISERDIDEFLGQHGWEWTTKKTYGSVLHRFLSWLGKRKEGEP